VAALVEEESFPSVAMTFLPSFIHYRHYYRYHYHTPPYTKLLILAGIDPLVDKMPLKLQAPFTHGEGTVVCDGDLKGFTKLGNDRWFFGG